MKKWHSIDKLISSVSTIHLRSNPMEGQLQRTRGRLIRGVDIDGNPFAPYKTHRKSNQVRPLARAVRLYSDATMSASALGGDARFSMSISGRAAMIARYQNVKRTFSGFSREDRDSLRQDLLMNIGKGMK